MLYYILLIVTLLLWYFHRKFDYWRRIGIPQNTQWTPLGDMWDVGYKYHLMEKLDVLYRKYKGTQPLFGFYAMTNPMAVITDLDLIRLIMTKDFNNFVNRGMYSNEEADPLTMIMFSLEGERWRRIRNSLSPTFTSGKMKGMLPVIAEKAQGLVEYFEGRQGVGGVLVKDGTTRYTADVTASTVFGLVTNALREKDAVILDVLNRSFGLGPTAIIRMMFLAMFPNFSAKLKLRQFERDVEEFFVETIRTNMEHRAKENVKRNDFFDMLMNLMNRGTISDTGDHNPDGKLSFNEILAQAFLFFFAGYETSATTLEFAMYFLAKNHKIQSKLRDEVTHVKSKHGGMTYEALMEMTYLSQVFNETLRKYSPGGAIVRKASNDYKIPNTNLVIPKGMMCQIPMHSIHNDPEYYPDPDTFDPERFSPAEAAKRHPYAYIPFGEGPRNCLGLRFAHLQVKYALAVVVEAFEMSVNSKTVEPIQLESRTPFVVVKGGVWIDFKRI